MFGNKIAAKVSRVDKALMGEMLELFLHLNEGGMDEYKVFLWLLNIRATLADPIPCCIVKFSGFGSKTARTDL
jgi:hypothetical protein